MKQEEKNLPLSLVSLIFGGLSIPLAYARHLVSLALVLAVLAVAFGYWGQQRNSKHVLMFTAKSVKRARLGLNLGLVGTLSAVVMWALWASNVLLG